MMRKQRPKVAPAIKLPESLRDLVEVPACYRLVSIDTIDTEYGERKAARIHVVAWVDGVERPLPAQELCFWSGVIRQLEAAGEGEWVAGILVRSDGGRYYLEPWTMTSEQLEQLAEIEDDFV